MEKVVVACGFCSREREISKRKYESGEGKFCGIGCFKAFRSSKQASRTCIVCQDVFILPPSLVKCYRTCSKSECRALSKSGKYSPAWKGGKASREALSARAADREKKGLCKVCGRPSREGRVTCNDCGMKRAAIEKKRKERNTSLGICGCGRGKKVTRTGCLRHTSSSRCELCQAEQRTPRRVVWRAFKSAERRAKNTGVAFSLDFDTLMAGYEDGCKASGIAFNCDPGSPWAPSLDRIVPGGGYTMENTQLVCWLYNSAKGVYGHQEVLMLARALVRRATE